MTTPRASAPFPAEAVKYATRGVARHAPDDPTILEALGLVEYPGIAMDQGHAYPVTRTPDDWYGAPIDTLGQPNGPMCTPAHQPLHGPWAT